jgi:hypothetical protein
MMPRTFNIDIGYISNPAPKSTTKQQSSIYCGLCLDDNDEQNDAIQFYNDCKLSLCAAHVTLHQQAKETKDHSLIPIDQVSKDQLRDSFENKEINKAQEERESVDMASIYQLLSNILQKHTCFICHSQLSKHAKTTNGDGLLFCSEQCLKHYNCNNQRLDL